MSLSRTLVLFDFDGTITNQDTLLAFTRFSVGNVRFFFGMIYLAVPLVLQKIDVLSAHKVKEMFLTHFFGDNKYIDFKSACQRFSVQMLPQLVRDQAREVILSYQRQNCRIAIVSASPEDWIAPWAIQNGIEIIATRLEIKNSRITGNIVGVNCNGIEKVNRIKERFDLKEFDSVIVYGDTKGDYAMMELATQKYFKPFRDNK